MGVGNNEGQPHQGEGGWASQSKREDLRVTNPI